MESGSKLNTDFNSRIPAHEMIVFLSLHHVFKDLRNDSMHVKNFEYNVDQVKTAIRYYLDLFDGIRESIQTGVFPVQEKRLNVGDICLASVDKDQAFEYYLTLQDGSIGKLAKKDAILPPKGEKSNTVKERIKVRITSAGNLIKTCTMKDVPQNN